MAQMVVDLVQAHHVDVGAHHGVVFAGLQRPQIGLKEAAVQQAGQGVVAVGEVQLLADLVGLCILTHHHGGPGVLGAAVAAGQEFHGDPHELTGHVFAEAVGLRLLQEVVFASNPCKRIGLRCADIFIQLQFFEHDKSIAVGCFRQNMAFYKTA